MPLPRGETAEDWGMLVVSSRHKKVNPHSWLRLPLDGVVFLLEGFYSLLNAIGNANVEGSLAIAHYRAHPGWHQRSQPGCYKVAWFSSGELKK